MILLDVLLGRHFVFYSRKTAAEEEERMGSAVDGLPLPDGSLTSKKKVKRRTNSLHAQGGQSAGTLLDSFKAESPLFSRHLGFRL